MAPQQVDQGSTGPGGGGPGLDISIEGEWCVGCRNCEELAPGTFELDGDDVAFVADPAAQPVEVVVEAARQCPAEAITVRQGGRVLFQPPPRSA